MKRYAQTQNAGPLAEASESTLSCRLREFHDTVFAQHSSTAERNEVLVVQAHQIFKAFSTDDFNGLGISNSQSLRTSLGFLGRLQTSLSVLVSAAERLPGMDKLRVIAVPCPAPSKPTRQGTATAPSTANGRGWTLTKLFNHLGHDFTDREVKTVLGSGGQASRWTKSKLVQEFDKLKSSSWEVHAEMQLLPCYIEAVSRGESVIGYIGCSKKSCFLCWHFLNLFAEVRTRGSHGKLYNLWGLPEFQAISSAQVKRLVKSVEDLESLIRREILNRDTTKLAQVKESTVGASTISTIIPGSGEPSMLNMVSAYLQNQRANLLFPGSNAE